MVFSACCVGGHMSQTRVIICISFLLPLFMTMITPDYNDTPSTGSP
jgi:hypothetical protein